MSAVQITNTVEGHKVRIAMAGRFDFNSHRQFRQAYEDALQAPEVREIEIDLGNVDYLDSSALGMLLLLREKCSNVNKTLALSSCRGVVLQVLEVANFNKLFLIS